KDAVNARRDHQIADDDVGRFGDVLETQAVFARAERDALRARALDERAGGRVAVDEQLDLRGAGTRDDDAADRARAGNHGHVALDRVVGAFVDRQGPEIG